MMSRRDLLGWACAASGACAFAGLLPAWARSGAGLAARPGPQAGPRAFDLVIAETAVAIDGRPGTAVTVNGTVPGPLLRFREGDTVILRAHNRLREPTSIHWHGILLPFHMDGVPGVSFPGIPAGATFVYRYKVQQRSTYWYHSHSGLQEQLGHYGPIILDPAEPDPVEYDREHVIVLSDWMFGDPYVAMAKLKKQSDYFNFQRRTVGDFLRDAARTGLAATLKDRLAWGRMRMAPIDIADITGHVYTYLLNGRGPRDAWSGRFRPGERVRLRFINAASMSYFNVRIPGLPMTVVAADGQNVVPVETDEFQIAVAETYDVIVTPEADRAYTVFAESMDRSGYARGTLAPRPGMTAPVPDLRKPPLRSMLDMGMDMGGMEKPGTGDERAAPMPATAMGGGDGKAAIPEAGALPGIPPHAGMPEHAAGDMDMAGRSHAGIWTWAGPARSWRGTAPTITAPARRPWRRSSAIVSVRPEPA